MKTEAASGLTSGLRPLDECNEVSREFLALKRRQVYGALVSLVVLYVIGPVLFVVSLTRTASAYGLGLALLLLPAASILNLLATPWITWLWMRGHASRWAAMLAWALPFVGLAEWWLYTEGFLDLVKGMAGPPR